MFILVLLENLCCTSLKNYSGIYCRATTHTDLVVRAKKMGLKVKVIHNASVMNAIGACGLQLYRYGETISIPFFTDSWRPDSFYPKIQKNRQLGLHTLCLLGEYTGEGTIIGVVVQIVILCFPAYNAETQCVGIARLGNDDQMIVAGSMKELLDIDFGPPLHCLVIVGETHPVEEEMLEFYSIKS
ncbi:hypothetical protein BHE74_00028515 [Ensete ventricosum]|nr:hypothetical protein BHE74_00028515 [Ensete ventricosum]